MNPNPQKFFERAYQENADALFRFTVYRVSDKEQAIDIVEDAFVRFWQNLLKEEIKEPRAFLFKITRNLIIDWYRKKKSVPVQDFGDSHGESGEQREVYMDMFAGNLAGAEVELEAKMLAEKIAMLEPKYREAVYLRYVEELNPREISEILGESPNVVSVRINRGVKLLKARLHI